MATINVLDAAGSTVAVARAADTGRAAASASLPTVLSTEDKAALDAAVTDLAAIEVLQTAGNASLAIMDDWDESDRAKVNVIVGQAGISAGAGAVEANTPRITHASDDPLITALSPAGTGSQTNVSIATSATVVLAENTARKGAMIYNDGSTDVYLLLSDTGTVSTSLFSYKLAGGAGFVLEDGDYTGRITHIAASASGTLRVTEFSA